MSTVLLLSGSPSPDSRTAVLLAHTGDLFHLGRSGGYALELQAMYLFTAVALALTGAGRFSVGGRYGPLN